MPEDIVEVAIVTEERLELVERAGRGPGHTPQCEGESVTSRLAHMRQEPSNQQALSQESSTPGSRAAAAGPRVAAPSQSTVTWSWLSSPVRRWRPRSKIAPIRGFFRAARSHLNDLGSIVAAEMGRARQTALRAAAPSLRGLLGTSPRPAAGTSARLTTASALSGFHRLNSDQAFLKRLPLWSGPPQHKSPDREAGMIA